MTILVLFFFLTFLSRSTYRRQSSWPCQASGETSDDCHSPPTFIPLFPSFRQQTKKNKMPPNYPWSRRAAVPFDDGHPRQRNLPGNSTDTAQERSVFVFSSFRFLRLCCCQESVLFPLTASSARRRRREKKKKTLFERILAFRGQGGLMFAR